MDLQLSGKVVVVTGGGRGHGESMSLALADEGAKVVVLDVNGENARNVQERIAQRGCTGCLLYTSPSPRDRTRSRMPSSA